MAEFEPYAGSAAGMACRPDDERVLKALANVEGFVRFPSGEEVPVLHQTAPVIIDGELVAVVAVFQDITRLKEADQAKNQFLMVLGHEIKTPLTNIIGWAQLAQGAPDIAPEAIDTILSSAYKQKDLLERLLTLSRILSGKLSLLRARLDLRQLVDETIAHFEPLAGARQITITNDLPEEDLSVEGDAKYLQQALSEAVANAVQFTEAGGRIIITGTRTDEHVIFSVRDTGRGIAHDDLRRLQTPFTQIQREEGKGGLGIGLALAKGIIEAHGGTIILSSPGEGLGSTFTLELRRAV